RDRVAVVGHEIQQRQVQTARGVERLPELAFARRALAERYVRDLVTVRIATRKVAPLDVARRLRAPDGRQTLRGRGRGLRDDVLLAVAPMARHLSPAARGIFRRTD